VGRHRLRSADKLRTTPEQSLAERIEPKRRHQIRDADDARGFRGPPHD
jgi:hypothetical protein